MAAWRRITVGNGGKGALPMASRRTFGFGPSRQVRPSCSRWKAAGIAAQAMRGSIGLTHQLRLGMPARERTRGGAIRETDIANREGQRVVRDSASLTSERERAEFRGSGEQPASWRSVKYPVGERQAACRISWPKRRGSDRGAHAGMGSCCLAQLGRAIAWKAVGAGSSPAIATTSMNETQRRVPVRAESGSRPKPPGNSAVPKPQAEGPWRNAARLGSPHSEPARLTVSELPTRYAARVNRHTPKKAVMVAYVGAGFGWAAVDRRATVARQRGRYSRQRVAVNDVVSVVLFFGPVAQQAEHATDNREGDRSNRSRSTTLWE